MKSKLKLTIGASTALVTLLLSSTVFATDNSSLAVVIDDQPLAEPVQISFEDHHMLVPLRTISESLGYEVNWNSVNKDILVNKTESNALLHMNSQLAELNGNVIELDVAPVDIDGSTMVPLRFIARKSEVGISVDTTSTEQQIKISTETPENSLNADSIIYLQTDKMQGSGIILSNNGMIATNYHVVEGASTIQIIFNDGTEYTGQTKVIGLDAQKDIAILQIEARDLDPAIVNLQQEIISGDVIYTIGSPHGNKNFISEGVIIDSNSDSINMSALIDKGNSGGGLFHENGNLLGMTYAFGKNQNLAIPIQTIANIPRNLDMDFSEMKYYDYKPTAPENLRSYTEGQHTYFTWSPVYGADYYHVYISDGGEDGKFERLYNTTLESDIWYWAFPHAFGLGSDGQTVYIKVSAVVDGVEGEISETLKTKL